MAPELIMGQKVTQTIDVYSLGCVIDEIMTEKTCYWDYCMKGITQERVGLLLSYLIVVL